MPDNGIKGGSMSQRQEQLRSMIENVDTTRSNAHEQIMSAVKVFNEEMKAFKELYTKLGHDPLSVTLGDLSDRHLPGTISDAIQSFIAIPTDDNSYRIELDMPGKNHEMLKAVMRVYNKSDNSDAYAGIVRIVSKPDQLVIELEAKDGVSNREEYESAVKNFNDLYYNDRLSGDVLLLNTYRCANAIMDSFELAMQRAIVAERESLTVNKTN